MLKDIYQPNPEFSKDARIKSMDEYYALQGWDVETGWPTRARLAELGVDEMYGPMVEGARRAKTRLKDNGADVVLSKKDEEHAF